MVAKEKIDLGKYWEIIYRATSQFIRFNAGGYKQMLMIKSHKIGKHKVTINAESIEIIGNKSIFTDNVFLTFPMTNDSELLCWTWKRGDGAAYDISDWVLFTMSALRNRTIERK